MIKRVQKIQQIGTFRSCVNVGGLTLDKFNVFYGHNTYGKSTFNDIFKALSQNDPTILYPRRSIPQDLNLESKIELSFLGKNGQEVPYSSTLDNWVQSPAEGKILIFDSDFAFKNVISGSELTRENKEFFTDFVLGESGVELSKKIQLERQALAQLKRDLDGCKPAYLVNIRDEKEIMEYVTLKITESEVDLINRSSSFKQTIENLNQSKAISLLPKIEIYLFNFEKQFIGDIEKINTFLTRDLVSIAADSLQVLNAHLKSQTKNTPGSEGWIREGFIDHKRGEVCPFCGQNLNNSQQLIDSYSKIFNEKYSKYIESVDKEASLLLASLNYRTTLSDLKYFVSSAINQLTKYIPYLAEINIVYDAGNLNREIDTLIINISTFVSTATEKIEVKKTKQTEKILPLILADELNDQINILKTEVAKFNQFLSSQIALCSLLKSKHESVNELQKQDELHKVLAELEDNEKRTKRLQQDASCKKYLSIYEKIDPLDSQIKKDTEDLETKQSEYLKLYFQDLNLYFKKLGSNDFSLNLQSDNRGYKKVFYIDVKYKGENISQSNLMKVFSESDKRSLGFAVFLSKLKHLTNKPEIMIIFDDPVVSFDELRIKSSIDIINELVPDFDQVFVLTHYPHYISQTIKVKSSAKYFRLIKDNSTSSYIALDSKDFIEPELDKCVRKIWQFINRENNENPIRDCRVFLEKYVELRFKKIILENSITFDSFGDLIDELSKGVLIGQEQKTILNKYRNGLNPDHHEFARTDNIENDRTYVHNFLEEIYNL